MQAPTSKATSRSPRHLHSELRRLPPEQYRGHAAVHWSMTVRNRATGWLDVPFHLRFRETLTHMAFRHHLAIPIYCLMPDHLHLLALGYGDQPEADQRLAIRFLRAHLTRALWLHGVALQKQPYDHVLRHDEAFEDVAWYIRENPLRAHLVPDEAGLRDYPFLGSLLPGFPEVSIWDEDYWTRFWRILAVREERARRSDRES